MRALIAGLVCVLAGSSVVSAQDCTDPRTQTDMTACATKKIEEADKALNATHKEMTVRLKDDADTAQLLVAAQKTWIAFRDAECIFATSQTDGGSIHPMIDAECREAITGKRIEDLKVYLNCGEGDLSCPVPAQ